MSQTIAPGWNPARTGPTDPAATELAGRLAGLRFVWPNEDGTCTVLAVLDSGVLCYGPLENQGELAPGASYRFLGRWQEHARHGWRFCFDAVLAEAPDDPDGAADYLARFADGIGPVTAARLVARYGPGVVRLLAESPEMLEADGELAGPLARAASASLKAVCGDAALRDAHLDLHGLLRPCGFWRKSVTGALRIWGTRAPAFVRRDPFLMMTAQLPGAGFARCDRLYSQLKLPQSRIKRQAMAAWHALTSLGGHTWVPVNEALRAVRAQIGGTAPCERRAVALLCRARWADCITDPAGQVWSADRYKSLSERSAARHLARLTSGQSVWPDVTTLGLDPTQDSHQIEQLAQGLRGPVAILGGAPGTGKTHCASLLARAMMQQVGRERLGICAPTGKAAVRLTQKLREAGLGLTATTVHRLLAVRPVDSSEGIGFGHGEGNHLPFSRLIVDESSMLDTGLFAALVAACATDTHLLLVGDINQLPPVGHGAPLRDLLAAGIPAATLREPRRNAGAIVLGCHAMRDGRTPKPADSLDAWPKQNLIRLSVGTSTQPADRRRLLAEKLAALYGWLSAQKGQAGPWDLIDGVQVIVARNATREALNRQLQQLLNAGGEAGPAGYRVADKVICLKNGFCLRADDRNGKQEYVANGDIGRVRGFRGQQMVVELAAPRRLVLAPLGKRAARDQADAIDATGGSTSEGDLAGSWDLAYAVTCHKYQGSEVPVAIVLAEGGGALACREWLYTAVSRARELCVLLGEQSDLSRAVKRVTLPDRKTFLCELIRGEMP